MEGKELRKVRKALGATQAALAERLAVSSNTVARWERDERRITAPMERLIAAVCREGGQAMKRGKGLA